MHRSRQSCLAERGRAVSRFLQYCMDLMTSWCAGKRCCSSLGPVCWLCWCTQSVSAKSFLVPRVHSALAPTLTFSTERAKGAYAAAAASYWDYARASDEKRKACEGFVHHSQAQHAQQAAVEDARISVQLSGLYPCSSFNHSVLFCPSNYRSLAGRQEEKEEKEEEARRAWWPSNWNSLIPEWYVGLRRAKLFVVAARQIQV